MSIDECSVMAMELMGEHGLDGWTLGYSHDRHVFGSCFYRKKTLTFSKWLVARNSPERVRLTILHEIAHALVDPDVAHGFEWRIKCWEIGGDGKRYYNDVTIPSYWWIMRYYAKGLTKHLGYASMASKVRRTKASQ